MSVLKWRSAAISFALAIAASSLAAAADFGDAATAYRAGDYRAALDTWAKLAELGDADAQYNLGCMFLRGDGVAADKEQAAGWFKKSAARGQSDAAALVSALASASGPQQDPLWVANLSAETPPAQSRFMLNYTTDLTDGDFIRFLCKDPLKDAPAIFFRLGFMYSQGLGGMPQDDFQAVRWWRRAADFDVPVAQYLLAGMYAKGRGIMQDYREAEMLDAKAASRGETHAQVDLGFLFEEGLAGPVDLVAAYVLYRHAIDQGNASARERANMLIYRLSKDQREEAEAIIAGWKAGATMPKQIWSRLSP